MAYPTNAQYPPLSKHKKIIPIAVTVGVILLILFGVFYIGVLGPGRFLPSQDYETGDISIQVNHGKFAEAESALRRAVNETGAKIYHESIYESDDHKYGSFMIDVPKNAAEGLISKLRSIGHVKSFSYSKGTYQQNRNGANGLQKGYVRIYVSLSEKKSMFSSLSNLEVSSLGSTFIGSIVALFYFMVAVLPWVLVISLIYFLVKYIKRKFSN